MKILAISDIHNNIACVRKLRAQEANEYDVIVIAGDIGSHAAADIFATLATFECPIVYVHGNWDRMAEDAKVWAGVQLVHLKAVKVGSLTFAGYSFRAPLPRQRRVSGTAEYTRRCRALLRAAPICSAASCWRTTAPGISIAIFPISCCTSTGTRTRSKCCGAARRPT
jgi:hypothetical protein